VGKTKAVRSDKRVRDLLTGEKHSRAPSRKTNDEKANSLQVGKQELTPGDSELKFGARRKQANLIENDLNKLG